MGPGFTFPTVAQKSFPFLPPSSISNTVLLSPLNNLVTYNMADSDLYKDDLYGGAHPISQHHWELVVSTNTDGRSRFGGPRGHPIR